MYSMSTLLDFNPFFVVVVVFLNSSWVSGFKTNI